MGTSLQEKMASLPSERQTRIKAETAQLQAAYMALKELRPGVRHDSGASGETTWQKPSDDCADGKTYGFVAFDVPPLYRGIGRSAGSRGAISGSTPRHSKATKKRRDRMVRCASCFKCHGRQALASHIGPKFTQWGLIGTWPQDSLTNRNAPGGESPGASRMNF